MTTCDREPIRIPGSIQPHGVLLALDPDTFAVLQVAGDSARILGQPPAVLLGKSIEASLGSVAIERLSLMTASQPLLPRPSFIFDIAIDNLALDVSAHVSGGLTILEFEPRSGAATNGIATVQSMVARLQTSTDVQTLLDAMASEVQRVTEFDHVMVYRFLEDDSGHVVAECRASPAVDSYLDLHYPASDIPVQARELYRACWIRSIPDATYAPMPLTPANNPKTGEPLDLS